MNRFKIFSKALLLLLVTTLTFAVTSCSDDDTEGWDTTYGYVQFKDFLYAPVTYGTVKGYETLNTWYHFKCPFDDYTIYDWESEKALPMTISTN